MSATVNFSVFINPTLSDKLLSLVGSADFYLKSLESAQPLSKRLC